MSNFILQSTEGFKYRNKANSWQVYFSDYGKESPMVYIVNNEYSIGFSYIPDDVSIAVNAESEVSADAPYAGELREEQNYILYPDIEEGVDLLYRVGINSIKEELIVKKRGDKNEFCFSLLLSNINPVLSDGNWVFIDKNERVQFKASNLFMMDANGNRSEKVTCEMDKVGEREWRVRIIADPDFLNDPKTAYPVTIDPTYTVSGPSDTFDTYVSSENPGVNYYLETNLRTGYDEPYEKRYTYIKFNLPGGISSSSISSAKLKMRLRSYDSSMYPYTEASTCAFRVYENWQSSTITWNSKAEYTTSYYSGYPMIIDNWHIMMVTNIVKSWYAGTYSNYGFCVRDVNDFSDLRYDSSDPADWWTFYSSDYTTNPSRRPYLEITTGDINLELIVPCDSAARAYLGSSWQSILNGYLEEADNALYSQFGIDFLYKTYYSWSSPSCSHVNDYFGSCAGCTCTIQTCPGCCSGCRSNGYCYFYDCECLDGDWGDMCRYFCDSANLGQKGILKDVLQDCGLQGTDLMTAFVNKDMYYVADLSEVSACDGVGLREYAYAILDITAFPVSDRPTAILHEVGHTLGCNHCSEKCVMNFNVYTRKFGSQTVFCDSCKAIINKYK